MWGEEVDAGMECGTGADVGMWHWGRWGDAGPGAGWYEAILRGPSGHGVCRTKTLAAEWGCACARLEPVEWVDSFGVRREVEWVRGQGESKKVAGWADGSHSDSRPVGPVSRRRCSHGAEWNGLGPWKVRTPSPLYQREGPPKIA